MRRLLAFLLLAALGAFTQQQVNAADAARATTVVIGFQPPDTCSISVDGKTFILSKDRETAVAAMKREFTIHPDAHLVADLNVPYKCVGGAIIEAQRAGFKKIGFISEPPPPKGEQ
jgi:biopolymer transport protein ExbD